MMDTVLYTKSYSPPMWTDREILRYAGVRGEAPGLLPLLAECKAEIGHDLVYRVCFREIAVARDGGVLSFGPLQTSSADLAKNLAGCDCAVLFAATVGLAPDRAVARYAALSPTKALLYQAIGAERIESLCDAFEAEQRAEKRARGLLLRPRFSAGYGDLPLSAQRDIFAILDCQRRIGLTLNESLVMSPSKSVTAIIGVGI